MKAELLAKIDWPPPGHYVVAVSGGVDSVVLLQLLVERPDLRLRVAHYDHAWRDDSPRDAKLVRDLARIHGLPFHSQRAERPPATEAAARSERYQFLRDLVQSYDADGIITAHHFDDRAETSIFNLLRGSGRTGAASPLSTPGIHRPLLGVRKAELRAYADLHGLPWREDRTNNDLALDRNFLRRELLPSAKKQHPGFGYFYNDWLVKLDDTNRKLDELLEGFVTQETEDAVQFDRLTVQSLGLGVLEQLFAWAARHLDPGVQLNSRVLAELARAAKALPSGSRRPLPGGLQLDVGYDVVTISRTSQATPNRPQPVALTPQTSLRFGPFLLSYGSLDGTKQGVEIVPQQLQVRAPHPGDRIAPVGMRGHKKLQDLFVDGKVPRTIRLQYPVITSYNDEVVWVPGLAFSRNFLPPADAQTYRLSCQSAESL